MTGVPNIRVDIHYNDEQGYIDVELFSQNSEGELYLNSLVGQVLDIDPARPSAKAQALYYSVRAAINAWLKTNGRWSVRPAPIPKELLYECKEG